MKALSIRQPWAHLIIHGGKDIENRTWNLKHRGPLLIHAGKGCTRKEYADAVEFCRSRGLPEPPPLAELHRGGIVGSVVVVDCVEDSDSPWLVGPFGIVLAQPEPLEFIPWKGQLGLFDVDLPLATDRKLWACCPGCEKKPSSVEPLPSGWWWDAKDSTWAWCPECWA